MRLYILGLLAGVVLALPVYAERNPVQNEYAFDQPELLADQLVWGVAHGVRLLGRRCARAGHRPAAEAWIQWEQREGDAIQSMHERLAQHYFQRSEVEPGSVAIAIGLKPQLDLETDQLEAACATLAEALQHPRYDLAGRRAELLKP